MSFRKVVVGISGGVDSAVSALLLKQKGFDVCGLFMKNWDETDEKGFCSGEQDLLDSQIACKKIGVPLHQVNFVKFYWNDVFGEFLKDYEQGFTPNPDVLCNKYIKFDQFFKYAVNYLQADAIATGHYAQSSFGPFLEKYQPEKDVRLLKSADKIKDQTFFLCQVPQKSLRRTMFPIGMHTKEEVKEIARKFRLDNFANKKESTGICFIGQRNFQQFITEYIGTKPGDFVDIETGKVVGRHNGIHNWTLGQRCRLSGQLKPYFIAEKLVDTNVILVAAGTDHPVLYSQTIFASDPYWIVKDSPIEYGRCEFRFQHTKPLVGCDIQPWKQGLVIRLDEPLRAITPGQYAVFYRGQECLGCARILRSVNETKRKLEYVEKL